MAASAAALLDVQFGSDLHSVCNPPISSSRAVVVSPSLLGAERNVTHYRDIREELQQLLRDERNDQDWTFEGSVGRDGVLSLPGREVLKYKAGAVNDAVKRICEYFSVDVGTVGVGVLYRRGTPPCRYRSDDGQEGRNVTVVAFFGSVSTLFLRPRNAAADAATTVKLTLANNAVVAIGAGALRDGWEFGVQPVAPPEEVTPAGNIAATGYNSSGCGAAMPELFTMVVRGRSSAFVDRIPPAAVVPPPCARRYPSFSYSAAAVAAAEVSSRGSSDDSDESAGARYRSRRRGGSRHSHNSSSRSSSTTHDTYYPPRSTSTAGVNEGCPKRRRSRY